MATAFSLDKFSKAPPLERAAAVAKGLPAKAIRELVADRVISLADIARVVGPRRTLDRRLKENKRLSPEESDRLARFVGTLDLASEVLGGREVAVGWLTSPKRRFNGQSPLDLLKTDVGTRLVEEVLLQARYGFTA
jgi:putative toxin-antitoxin system antitoxin component (TIGR02293 family)